MSETTKKSPDIYKWKKEKVLNWLEEKWYNKESVKKILEKVQEKDKKKTSKEINDKLNSLEGGSKEHIEYRDSEQSIIENAKKKVVSVKKNIRKTPRKR